MKNLNFRIPFFIFRILFLSFRKHAILIVVRRIEGGSDSKFHRIFFNSNKREKEEERHPNLGDFPTKEVHKGNIDKK